MNSPNYRLIAAETSATKSGAVPLLQNNERCAVIPGWGSALIQACLVSRQAYSAERIEPLLAALALIEEVSNGLFDQLIVTPIAAGNEFLLDLLSQIRRQRYVHDHLLSSFYAFAAPQQVAVEGAVGHVLLGFRLMP
jgi:hypothetical protein